jgi:hypothetical protein
MSNPELKNACKNIASALQCFLSWKWDDRFGVVLAEFGTEDKDKILSVLEQHFNSTWDMSSIQTAPENVYAAADLLGGVDEEQVFFTSAIEKEILIFCAWWPWGNGKTISIRIAPFPSSGESSKGCFGL